MAQSRGTGLDTRLHEADCPGVPKESLARRDCPLTQGGRPVRTGRYIDLAEDDIDHPIQDVFLVPHMVVERHRLDPEVLGDLAHAERPEAAFVGEVDGSLEHPLPAQWSTGLGGRVGSGGHRWFLLTSLRCMCRLT